MADYPCSRQVVSRDDDFGDFDFEEIFNMERKENFVSFGSFFVCHKLENISFVGEKISYPFLNKTPRTVYLHLKAGFARPSAIVFVRNRANNFDYFGTQSKLCRHQFTSVPAHDFDYRFDYLQAILSRVFEC